MGLLEILLVFAGITICVISFRIPVNREEGLEETKELAKEEIKELVSQELSHVKEQVEGTVDETITYAVEKTERFMDRMSNEKMMAINEYSDTVMESIHKAHTEVMFLYDMLNEKHENIKKTVVEVDKSLKIAKDIQAVPQNEDKSNTVKTQAVHGEKKSLSIREQTEQRIRDTLAEKSNKIEANNAFDEPKTVTANSPEILKATAEQQLPEVDLNFSNMGMENSNEEILRLHKDGKSKVAIAKELGLGVGEVKLVIDLFEGM